MTDPVVLVVEDVGEHPESDRVAAAEDVDPVPLTDPVPQ